MPEKPWERARQANPAATSSSPVPPALPASSPAGMMSSSTTDLAGPPALPARSTAMGAMGATTSAGYRPGMNGYGSGYGSTGYGMSGYGSSYGSSYSSPYNRMGTGMGGYGSSYSSPYSRMGGYGSYGSSYGGGYGSSYGGYGSSYGGYGMNRMGMNGMSGMNGMNGMNGPMGPEEMSLMQRMEQGSAPTFQLIESVVGAFGGFAQMLESTFMATHSSFMAMVGVAEQFGHLRGYLGQVLSIFALLRWAKSLAYRMVGMKAPVNTQELTPGNFQEFQAQPRYSKRPIVIFLLAVFGLPYLMGRLIRALSNRNPAPQQGLLPGQEGQVTQAGAPGAPSQVNPQSLDFARALYDFTPSNAQQELAFRRGDIIAILSRQDPMGQESLWWRGRLRNGEMGLFPSNYVEIINKGGNGNSNSGNPAVGSTGLPGAPGAPNITSSSAAGPTANGFPAQPTIQQAADIQAALAGSAFEEFKF
ncbi:Peroxisomal membrane protein PAS20 [Linnemannia exigua]|uniref:Peroxisomal membrane protein PEX13 n=1 Tax=Linnemannia exigua TaxID=604196 RepID=A0AAD4DHU7_9FUNG|nr:Peroxisomal membrane protein PAS20 [Linnemannia exigua]